MPDSRQVRTEEDLLRTVRALAREFDTDTVFIIGSQAIMMSFPDAPPEMRGTPEIDAYPGNARVWEVAQAEKGEMSPEASEHIHGLFGEGSTFHHTHGFYIDGVDEGTARLPKGWNERAIVKRLLVDDRMVKAVAPAPEDVIVSKLARFDDKDKDFVRAYHRTLPLDLRLIEQRIRETDLEPARAEQAIAFIRNLSQT
jgi:hypothetical protein